MLIATELHEHRTGTLRVLREEVKTLEQWTRRKTTTGNDRGRQDAASPEAEHVTLRRGGTKQDTPLATTTDDALGKLEA